MKKLIFLDIDGVLNSENWYYRSRVLKNTNNQGDFDPETIKLLNELKDCEVVISSSWGDMADTPLILNGLTLPIIGHIDHSPYYNNPWICRGNCIAKWLLDNGYYCSRFGNHSPEKDYKYVIFDDDNDMLMSQKNNFIYVNRKIGLSQKDINKAKKILKIDDNSN